MLRSLAEWYWRRGRNWWGWFAFAYGPLAVATGITGLATGDFPPIFYVLIASGMFSLGIWVAVWAYQRRRPIPSNGQWYDNLYG